MKLSDILSKVRLKTGQRLYVMCEDKLLMEFDKYDLETAQEMPIMQRSVHDFGWLGKEMTIYLEE